MVIDLPVKAQTGYGGIVAGGRELRMIAANGEDKISLVGACKPGVESKPARQMTLAVK